jgi:hypothetical protein
MTGVVVVPCGGAKLRRPAPAGQMYVGSYHRACRRAAAQLGGRLLILSARYGLLTPDTVIEPYELMMGQPGSVTADTLRRQARALAVDGAAAVVVLAGRRYADAAAAVWPHAIRPLDGAAGMGPQLHRLAVIARTGELAPVTATEVVIPRAYADPAANTARQPTLF